MKKAAFALLTLSLLMVSTLLTPVFAKNMNVPEGADIIYVSNGYGFVTAPNDWPTAGSSSVVLRIKGIDVEAGTYGPADNIEIDMPYGPGTWIPLAYFTTNSNAELLAWNKALLSGFPCSIFPPNMKAVSESVLQVERHGNSITIALTAPQTVIWPTSLTTAVPVVIPAFTIELNKVGGSIHSESITSLTGYPGASGWTGYIDQMGFNANGVFTSPGWGSEMTECFITMHGIATWVPP